MTVYRTQFERINFDFDPPLKQTADVVFQCDSPDDIDDAMWKAMRAQNPHWSDYSSPIEGYSGWSSVLGGYKFEEVVDEGLDFDLGEPGTGLPRIAETFRKKDSGSQYRLTSFYKTFVPKKAESEDESFLDGLLADIKRKEREEMTPDQRNLADSRFRIVQCEREEAEFVGGSGVAGCIARIEDIVLTGRVTWQDRTIARARRDYKIHDRYPTDMYKYWEK